MDRRADFLNVFGKFINIELITREEKDIEELNCHNCLNSLKLVKRALVCGNCSLRYFLPKEGAISVLSDSECLKCTSKLLSITKSSFSYKICPRCFNYPEPHMMPDND